MSFNVNPIVRIYADLVRKGLKTLEQVPENLRQQVVDFLDNEFGGA